MKQLDKKYIDILEENDWGYYIDEASDEVELEKYSPAGEDFICYVNIEDFPDAVLEYAEDFDVDEHVELWVDSIDKNGCPSTFRELVEDAEAIKEMLMDLAAELTNREELKPSKIIAFQGYWMDENYNCWDRMDYTHKEAEELSKTLINCYFCLNCYDCENCEWCVECEECKNCSKRQHCLGCEGL